MRFPDLFASPNAIPPVFADFETTERRHNWSKLVGNVDNGISDQTPIESSIPVRCAAGSRNTAPRRRLRILSDLLVDAVTHVTRASSAPFMVLGSIEIVEKEFTSKHVAQRWMTDRQRRQRSFLVGRNLAFPRWIDRLLTNLKGRGHFPVDPSFRPQIDSDLPLVRWEPWQSSLDYSFKPKTIHSGIASSKTVLPTVNFDPPHLAAVICRDWSSIPKLPATMRDRRPVSVSCSGMLHFQSRGVV